MASSPSTRPATELLEGLRARVLSLPPVLEARSRIYHRRFQSSYAAFWGVYGSFAEALAAAPKGKPLGFDQAKNADDYRDRMHVIYSYDYPVLFWLERMKPGPRTVFDFGGSVGVHYYSYRRVLDLPPDIAWTVSEVSTVVAAGREMAAARREKHLHFTTELEDLDGSEVFLSAGAWQYLEGPGLLASLLGKAKQPPKHVLLNKLPIYDGPSYVTLQNVGISYVAHQTLNAGELISSVCAVGYELVDRWKNYERSLRIPFHPERGIDQFSGLYFRRKS